MVTKKLNLRQLWTAPVKSWTKWWQSAECADGIWNFKGQKTVNKAMEAMIRENFSDFSDEHNYKVDTLFLLNTFGGSACEVGDFVWEKKNQQSNGLLNWNRKFWV